MSVERAKFTNGQVRVPVMIQGNKHRQEDTNLDPNAQLYVLVDHFPCFIANDGKMTVQGQNLNEKPLLSSRKTTDNRFYGINVAQQPHGRHGVTRVDVVTRGTYAAPQAWLYTPTILTETEGEDPQPTLNKGNFDDDYAVYDNLVTGNNNYLATPTYKPYLQNCGVIMYNMREAQDLHGYPFVVSRYQSLIMMKREMARPEGEPHQFIVIGQFFSHVTDWVEAQQGNGQILEDVHQARCRHRLMDRQKRSLKERRRAKRTFQAFLRT